MSPRDPWPPVPWEAQSQGALMRQPMPQSPPMSTPERGRQVDFKQNAAGTLVTADWQPLLRAVDKQVRCWNVTLSPVFRRKIGPVPEGMSNVAADSGSPRFRMTWGAGGVTFRCGGFYPVAGSSFTVAADNLTVEVMVNDGVTVFTADTVPSVLGWVTEMASPQTATPFYNGTLGNVPLYGPFAPTPWTRAIVVYADTAGATITVTLASASGTLTAVVASGTRVALPASVNRVSATASAGNVGVVEEISFA